jgi:hypothetical protein
MAFVKLGLVQGARSFRNYSPYNIIEFRILKSEHPVFELSGKNSRFFFEKRNSDG